LRADSQAAQDELYRILVADLKTVVAETARIPQGAARAMSAKVST
jgi:hypothetical protein